MDTYKKTKNSYGLFIFLGNESNKFEIIKLIEYEKATSKLYMGISILKSGSHKTACGKGYWNCEQNEPALLTLENHGINFFKFESASSVYYWDKDLNKFNRIWLSD